MDFRNYLQTFQRRVEEINEMFEVDNLKISFDTLRANKKADKEILYFKQNSHEQTGIYIFGFKFFQMEHSEQEFKKLLGQNSLNFKIYKAYHDLKKTQKKVKISEILTKIQDKQKDSYKIHTILRRILTLAYYLNWKLTNDKNDLEQDKFIEINNGFLLKVQQRYNFDIITAIYENDDVMMFMNGRAKLNIIFKNLDQFNKADVQKLVFPVLKKVFKIKTITVK